MWSIFRPSHVAARQLLSWQLDMGSPNGLHHTSHSSCRIRPTSLETQQYFHENLIYPNASPRPSVTYESSLIAEMFEENSIGDLEDFWLGEEEQNPELRWIYVFICIGAFDCVRSCISQFYSLLDVLACTHGAPWRSNRVRVFPDPYATEK